jgi:hypothetical protein
MVIKDLIGKEVIWKGNKCQVLDTALHENGSNLLQLEAEETEKTQTNPWVDIDEVRIDVYFTQRPRLFGTMVDAYDGVAKVEWKDADGFLVPFRKDPKTGQLILDKENRPIMTMKVFDCRLDEMSLY